MKKTQLIVAFILLAASGYAQQIAATKRSIDTTAISRWTQLGTYAISNNGKYIFYTITNQPFKSATLVIKTTDHKWQRSFIGAEQAVFTQDSRKVICKKEDSLLTVILGSLKVTVLPQVKSFSLVKVNKAEELVYQLADAENTLVLQNTETGSKSSYQGVAGHNFNKDNSLLVLKTTDNALKVCDLLAGKMEVYKEVAHYKLGADNRVLVLQQKNFTPADQNRITWVDRQTGKQQVIWEGSGLSNLLIDKNGTQVAFEISAGDTSKSIGYYKEGVVGAAQLMGAGAAGEGKYIGLNNESKFSQDGTRLFCSVIDKEEPKVPVDAIGVDVWSYTDVKLQSEQMTKSEKNKSYLAMINLEDKKLTKLQQPGDNIMEINDQLSTSFSVPGGGSEGEYYWSKAVIEKNYLIDTRRGNRTELPMSAWEISPDNRYLLLSSCRYDGGSFYSYNLATDKIVNLTANLPTVLGDAGDDHPEFRQFRGLWFKCWLTDHTALIYDKYDIWKIDVRGKEAPVNLTNGYGRKHHMIFRFVLEHPEYGQIDPKGTVLLSAFNNETKANGFYRIDMCKLGDPEYLSMGQYAYATNYAEGGGHGPSHSPIKATKADIWLIERESADASPNIFITRDFKTFRSVSDIHPEDGYNWLTSELINFKTLDGKDEQGVLYKPKDFNPHKKYPVIFFYYERVSGEKNKFWLPELSEGEINIPWFVSRGYLVFRPDIHYKIGDPMQSALNSIVGSANFLKTFPFVDSEHMGLQGHSFGGLETNYVITHSTLFAAACGGAGPVDLISLYGSLDGSSMGTVPHIGSASKQFWTENHQLRIGTSLWDRPDLYISNSPIFNVDKVTTPVLIMHNKNDPAVPFQQGIEWFTALRRLGKRAWLLQYDGQTHALWDKGCEPLQVDWTLRMDQFFAYYLKGELAPVWMTRGIAAKDKGLKNGYEYDTKMKTPGLGLPTAEEQQRIDSLQYRKSFIINLK